MFTCCVIGETTLALRCCELIVAHGGIIVAVVTSNDELKAWSAHNSIPYCSDEDFQLFLSNFKFDYLFSIVNSKLLPRSILQQPKNYSINFHDSLLPKYAGLFATSWAIFNGEENHGITWHVMSEVIDAGDILKQAIIPINKDETAFSLNLKCYEQATKAFNELICELNNNSFKLCKQNLTLRTYYPLAKSLPNGGFISWTSEASIIDRTCRALNFGNYPNMLGLSKFVIASQIFVIIKHSIDDSLSQLKPGQIAHISNDAIKICTATTTFCIHAVATIDGKMPSIPELIQRFSLTEGYQLELSDVIIENMKNFGLIEF